MAIYSFDDKAEFFAASLQCRMILQKSFVYADLVLKKHFSLLLLLKTVPGFFVE